MPDKFGEQLAQIADRVTTRLDALLSTELLSGEKDRPARLIAAMRHGVLNGGKRVRPFLVIQSAALFGVAEDEAMQTACALECLHCYSLIHDETNHPDPSIRAGLANLLARASGLGGMIGGQTLDIAAETVAPDEDGIRLLQSMKTGALIRFACEAGAVLGGASASDRQRLVRYGEIIGLAFQLTDDLLDVTAKSEDIGKATGKDAEKGKGTLVGIHGVQKVGAMLEKLRAEADEVLEPFGERGEILRQTAQFVIERKT